LAGGMKKYARLRQDCSEFDNALYDATPEGSFTDHARAPSRSGLTLTGALKKLGSFREVGASRRQTESSQWQAGQDAGQDASESGRWANAETASLSGRWGSVSTNDHWDEATLSLSRSGRLEGEPWTAPKSPPPIPRQASMRDPAPEVAIENANPSDQTSNISMKETQGWLGSVRRPARKADDPSEFNWRAATSTTGRESCSRRGAVAAISQSMRYDRLRTMDLVENSGSVGGGSGTVMQKAASMREGGAHSDAIMAMARAYSEKHGVPQAILECVACGRALGVVVQGNPGADTSSSFCQPCRSVGAWTFPPSKPKRKGMMHFCKKILRMGKKPNNKSKG
jgi:hypothetical protein